MAISPPRTSTLAQRGPKRETLLKAIQMFQRSILATAAVLAFTAATAHAGEVEVLHYWTSGGEAKSAAELRKMMQSKGHTWKDFAVAGGGGDNAMTVLKSRVVSGNPPAAAQIKGPAIQEWAAEGVLANLDAVAKAEQWDKLLPKVVADVMKSKGNYVAAPVNVHRVNWMWANAAVLKKAGVTGTPKTWDEFFAAAEKVKKAGLIPVAHGGQNWQDFTTFESVVLGVGGAKFYQDALVKLDPKALNSPTMKSLMAVALAASSAFSGVATMKAFSADAAATCALKASAASVAVNVPLATPSRMAATPILEKSVIIRSP